MASITDGASNTYLIGEKNVNADAYFDASLDPADSGSIYLAHNWATCRWTYRGYYPLQDRPGATYAVSFGSAHSGGFNMVFCDGAVHTISYTIDPIVHEYLGNRHDNQPIDASKF